MKDVVALLRALSIIFPVAKGESHSITYQDQNKLRVNVVLDDGYVSALISVADFVNQNPYELAIKIASGIKGRQI